MEAIYMKLETKQMYGTEITIIKYQGEEAEMIDLQLEGDKLKVNEDVSFQFAEALKDYEYIQAMTVSAQDLPDGRKRQGLLAIAKKYKKDGTLCCHYYVAVKKDENNSGVNIKQMANIVLGLGIDSFQVSRPELIAVEELKANKVVEEEIPNLEVTLPIEEKIEELKINAENISGDTLGVDSVIKTGTIKASDLKEKPKQQPRKKQQK